MDPLRRMIRGAGRRTKPECTPVPSVLLADTLERAPFLPHVGGSRGISVPPVVGQLGYYNPSKPAAAWKINGTQELCHFSAPKWVYPGPAPYHVGIIDWVGAKVDIDQQLNQLGTQRPHVLPLDGFSMRSTDERGAGGQSVDPSGSAIR